MSKKNYYLTRGVCNYTVTIFSGISEGNKAPAAKTVLKPLSFTTEEQNAYRGLTAPLAVFETLPINSGYTRGLPSFSVFVNEH